MAVFGGTAAVSSVFRGSFKSQLSDLAMAKKQQNLQYIRRLIQNPKSALLKISKIQICIVLNPKSNNFLEDCHTIPDIDHENKFCQRENYTCKHDVSSKLKRI